MSRTANLGVLQPRFASDQVAERACTVALLERSADSAKFDNARSSADTLSYLVAVPGPDSLRAFNHGTGITFAGDIENGSAIVVALFWSHAPPNVSPGPCACGPCFEPQ